MSYIDLNHSRRRAVRSIEEGDRPFDDLAEQLTASRDTYRSIH
jgi:hypothetical protein